MLKSVADLTRFKCNTNCFLVLVPLGETSLEFYESLPLILSVNDHLPTPTFPESIVKEGGNEHSQPHGHTSPVKIQDNKNENDVTTLETLAKVLPPPSRSTFYVPVTKCTSSTSTTVSSTNIETNSGPASPLGGVSDTVICGTMAGLHAVAGLPSAVSSLPIVDADDNILGKGTNAEQQRSSENNHSGIRENEQWSCAECTFLNHPALKECEQCEMPRVMIGTELYRKHEAKTCFCHPQDTLHPKTQTNTNPLQANASNNDLPNSNAKSTNQKYKEHDEDLKLTSSDEKGSDKVLTGLTSDNSKISFAMKDYQYKDDSPTSDNTTCT